MTAAMAAPIAQEFPGDAAEVFRPLISAPMSATGSPPIRREGRLVLEEAAEVATRAAAAALAGDLSSVPRTKFPED